MRGTPAELLAHFSAHAPRGEFVLVLQGAPADSPAANPADLSPDALAEAVRELEGQGMDRKAAMKEIARRLGLRKRDVYQALLQSEEKE